MHNLHVAHPPVMTEILLIAISILVAVAGVLYAFRLYGKHDLAGDDKIKKLFGGLYKRMEGKFFVDELYEAVLLKPFVWLSRKGVVPFDQQAIDGIVDGTGVATRTLGERFKRLQTGMVQNYALLMAVGIVGLLGYMLYLQAF